MNKFKDVATRLTATFVAAALSVVGISSILEQTIKGAPSLPLWYSAVLAGTVAVVEVVRRLADALKDGELTQEEIDSATSRRNAATAVVNAETADINADTADKNAVA